MNYFQKSLQMSRYKFIEYGLCITLFFATIIPLTLKYKYYDYNLSDFQMYVQNVPIYKYLLGALLIDVLFIAVLIIRQLALPNITEQELQQARKNKTVDLFSLVLLIGQNFYQIYRFDLMVKSIITSIIIFYVDQINYLFKNRINTIQIQISQLPSFKRNKKQYVNIIIDHVQLLRCIIVQILFFYLELKNILGDNIKKLSFEYFYTLTQYQLQFMNIIFPQIIEFSKNLIKLLISPLVYFYQEDLQNISIIGKITDFIIQISYCIGSSYYIADQILIINQKYTISQYIQKYILKKYKNQKMQIRKTKLNKSFIFFAILQQIEVLHATFKSYTQMKLSIKSYKKLQNFPEPTLKELYNESNEEVIRKHKHKYLSEALCSICLNQMDLLDGSEAIRKLPCGHCYHLHCIRQWINEGKNQCPVCNKQIFEQDLQEQLNQIQQDALNENQMQDIQNIINQWKEETENQQQENKQKDNEQILQEINQLQEQKKDNNQVQQKDIQSEEKQQKEDNQNNSQIKVDTQNEEQQNIQVKEQSNIVQEQQFEQKSQKQDKIQDDIPVQETTSKIEQEDQTDEQIFAQLLLGQEEAEKQTEDQQEVVKQEDSKQEQQPQIIQQQEQEKEQIQIQQEEKDQKEKQNQQIQQNIENIEKQKEGQEEYVQPENILYAAKSQKLFQLQFCTQQNIEKLDLDILIKECDLQYQQFRELLKQAQENQYNYKLQLELYKLIQKQQK